MEVERLSIPGLLVLTPRKFGDHRGFFSEVWSRRAFADAGLDFHFVQDNHSMSAQVGTVRGLHYQSPPHAQTKLIRCTRGRIRDVAIDIRKGSATFGQHAVVDLDPANWKQLLVPTGFAHGFVTLEPDSEVLYKVDSGYAPDHDAGLYWADPALNIDWGVDVAQAVVSEKDKALPRWDEFDSPFVYEGDGRD